MVGWYGLDLQFSNGFVSQAQESIKIVYHTKCQQKWIMVQPHQQNFCEIIQANRSTFH